MGVKAKKGPALASIFLAMMIVFHRNTNICRATAAPPPMKKTSNSSSGGCEGWPKGCLIGNMDLDEELLIMDSDISRRMMVNIHDSVTKGTGNANRPAVACAPGKPYDKCLPMKNDMTQYNERCSTYKRGGCQ